MRKLSVWAPVQAAALAVLLAGTAQAACVSRVVTDAGGRARTVTKCGRVHSKRALMLQSRDAAAVGGAARPAIQPPPPAAPPPTAPPQP